MTSSTGSLLHTGLSWSGAKTCSLPALHSGIRRTRAVMVGGVPSRVNRGTARARGR
ncbi:hypothetical protein [Streptomyces sp. NPDC088246]|uniref:hypothetical protein n=1 Tax=Streptomyces sp. NPDC088246 TaxID=3365842 RepID=UPI0037FD93BE